jgi:hypothetical protein
MDLRRSFAVLGLSALLLLLSLSSGMAAGRATSGPPQGLTVYGQTLWNLEALLHDTFGNRSVCLRLRDDVFLSETCGDLARYGYWKNMFVGARDSRFRLVRRAHAPALGNVVPVRVKGLYVFCGNFPVAFGSRAGSGKPGDRWLVLLHGSAMLPFACL